MDALKFIHKHPLFRAVAAATAAAATVVKYILDNNSINLFSISLLEII